MTDEQVAAPDNTAVRVALWRALHVVAGGQMRRRPLEDNSEELLVATT